MTSPPAPGWCVATPTSPRSTRGHRATACSRSSTTPTRLPVHPPSASPTATRICGAVSRSSYACAPTRWTARPSRWRTARTTPTRPGRPRSSITRSPPATSTSSSSRPTSSPARSSPCAPRSSIRLGRRHVTFMQGEINIQVTPDPSGDNEPAPPEVTTDPPYDFCAENPNADHPLDCPEPGHRQRRQRQQRQQRHRRRADPRAPAADAAAPRPRPPPRSSPVCCSWPDVAATPPRRRAPDGPRDLGYARPMRAPCSAVMSQRPGGSRSR